MTTAYTSLLGLALPVTGELSGTWGDTVNNSITSLLDSAIAGTTTLSTDADVTLTTTTGASNTSRQAILLWTAGGTVTRTITAPQMTGSTVSKIYTVINASTSTQSIKVVGAIGTGVTIVKGESALIAWNGSDFVKVSNSGGSFTTQDLTVTGNTILGDAITDTTTLNAQTRFLSLATLGYSNMTGPAATSLSTTAPAFLYSGATTYTVSDVSGGTKTHAPIISLGQTSITNATTATTFTNASTLYIGGTPNASTNITFTRPYALYLDSGTTTAAAAVTYTNAATLYIAGAPTAGSNVTLTTPYALYVNAGNVYLGGGTANGVAYLDTNKVLTTGSALTFDGSTLVSKGTTNGNIVSVGGSGTASASYSQFQGYTGSGDSSNINYVLVGNKSGSTYLGIPNNGVGIDVVYGSTFSFALQESEIMRLTSTSLYTASTINVGIGTSTPTAGISLDKYGTAWNTSANTYPFPAGNVFLAMGATAATNNWFGFTGFYGNSSGSANILLQANVNNTSQQAGNFIGSLVTGAASADLQFGTMTAAATNAGNSVKNEQMRLDSSGNLGLGVTPTAWTAGGKIFELGFKGNIFYGVTYTAVGFSNNAYYDATAPSGWKFANPTSSRAGYYEQSQGTHAWATSTAAGTAGNAITFTQAMTLDASGNLLVGTTSTLLASNRRLNVIGTAGGTIAATGTGGEPCLEAWQKATSGDNVFHQFFTETSATSRGSITYNRTGGLVNYGVTSDYRAKDIYGSIADSGALIDSVPVYMGKMKGATQERPMFIAHETPVYAHIGEKDAVDKDGNPIYQQMDTSALVPVMWAEIQSLRKRLAAANL